MTDPTHTHIADSTPRWHHPDDTPAPRGVKLQLLTPGGISVTGHWEDWAVLWAPLLKVPRELKERIWREQGK